jgi:parvulin-like peptidyl-prolyl isomerase
VNGESILADDVARELKRIHKTVTKKERGELDLDRLMFRLVNDVLIGQEARALGMAEESSIADRVTRFQDELLLKLLDSKEIQDRAEPTEEEVRRLFREQYSVVQLRVVSSYDEEGAQQILAELRDGADMETLAREHSVDPIRVRGGLMKPAPRVELQRAVAEAAFSMELGQFAGPIQTKLGWTVIRIEGFEEPDEDHFAAAENTLRPLLRAEKARRLRAAVAETAKRHHPIEVDRAVVDAIVPVRKPDARLLAEPPDPQAIVASIGQRRILASEYSQALTRKWKGVRNIDYARAAAPIILDRLIERALLLSEAERRGYVKLPEVRRKVRSYETELLVPYYLEEVLAPSVNITDEQMRDYYAEHQNRFRKPPRVRVGQITVETPEEAERRAEAMREGADLAWLAKQYSMDEYAERGGDRGWLTPTPGADETSDWLLAAEPGDVGGPLLVNGAYVVVEVLDREQQEPYTFDEVSGNVREAIFKREFGEQLDRFIKKLRSRSEIAIHEDRLVRLSIAGSVEMAPDAERSHDAH